MAARRPPTTPRNALRLVVLCLIIELLGFTFSGGYSAGSIAGIVLGTLCVYGLVRLVHRGVNWARWTRPVVLFWACLVRCFRFAPPTGCTPVRR